MKKTMQIVLKYAYPVALLFLIAVFDNKCLYSLAAFMELTLLFLITQCLFRVSHTLAQIFNYITLLLLNIQLTVLHFSGTWLTLAMVDNLDSIEDLSGKFGTYIPFVIVLIVCTCIPSRQLHFSIRMGSLCAMLLLTECLIVGVQTSKPSPMGSLVSLAQQYAKQKQAKEIVLGGDGLGEEFYKEDMEDFVQKPENLVDSPNVILILTEGLSQSIIDDERNIMPNVRKLQSESINFENYYNHTFATYNGISGQLYSGFQYEKDEKNLFISLQDIFENEGYNTSFINVEPFNVQFTNYLAGLEFDNLITDENLATDLAECISDKNAYDMLLNVCETQAVSEEPFFVAMYTVGTHVSWVCPDEKFADGSDEILNKFYNSDYQFGRFMEEFADRGLDDNTIVIYTTDHATYAESDYTKAFPDDNREHVNIGEIPFFIWYKGIENRNVDVNGRNSLDLAPTICDFLDISQPNYFLGTSLFGEEGNEYDTIHAEALSNVYSTENARIQPLTNEQLSTFQKKLLQYFSAKIKEDDLPFLTAEISEGNSSMKIVLENAGEYEKIWFLVWTDKRQQEDLRSYEGSKNSDGQYECVVNLCDYSLIGNYFIDAYTGTEGPKEKILSFSRYIDSCPDNSVKTEVIADNTSEYIKISYNPAEEYENIWFAVWSEKDGQDDINYYLGEKAGDNSWEYTVDLEKHFNDVGKYTIHVYSGEDTPEVFLGQAVVWTNYD